MVHGGVKVLFKALSAATLVVLFAGVVAVWRLSQGPVSVGFLAPYVAEALNDIDDQIKFNVKDAVVRWTGFRDRLEVQIVDVRALDDRGRVIAAFPEMAVRLSLLSILDGLPSPEEISIVKPVIRLTRTTERNILVGFQEALSAEPARREETLGPSPASLLAQALVQGLTRPGQDKTRVGYLKSVRISDATVVFADQGSGAQWYVPSGQIVLSRTDNGISVDGLLPFITEDKDSDVRVSGLYDASAGSLSISLEFEDVRPASFAPLLPQFSFLSGASIDVSGGLASRLSVTSSAVILDEVMLSVTDASGPITIPAPVNRTYEVSGVKLAGRIFDGLARAEIELSEVNIDGGQTRLSGMLVGQDLSSGNPTLNARLTIDAVTLDQLKRYWPEDIKPNTGRWISNNLDGGQVTDARFEFTFGGSSVSSLDVQEFAGQAQLSGIDVTYMRRMPPVLDTVGTITLSPSEVLISVLGGSVLQSGRDGVLDVEEGRVRLHGLNGTNHRADIDVRVDGKVDDIIALIDSEPLQYASALGISPNETSGDANVALAIDFPLIQELRLADVEIMAQASLSEVAIAQAALNLDLTSGQFGLELDNNGMNVTGTAALGGIRAGVSWRENFSDAEFKRRYAVDAVIENEQRPLVGLGASLFEPPYMDGPVRVEALYTVGNDDAEQLIVEGDVSNALLNFDEINWVKPPGVPALVSAEVSIPDGGEIEVRQFTLGLEGQPNALSGSISLQGNTILALNVDSLLIGENRMSLTARRQDTGVLKIDMAGDVLDGRSFWKSLQQSNQRRALQADDNQESLSTPISLSASLGRILLSESGEMKEADVAVVRDALGLQSIAFDAKLNDGTPFRFSLMPEGEERRFTAASENGGRVFRELGFGDDFVSGNFTIDGVVDELGAVTGSLAIADFKIVDAPLLARILSVAALTGIVDELSGSGISFSDLNLPFTYSENVLTIEDGAMYGPSLGVTARGDYNLSTGAINGQGTVIPAYALNSAFGAIPLIGPVLTGGERDGGVFAATYVIRGSEGKNEITVNPVATLAPGFLRQIFKVFEPAPVQAPAPSADAGQAAQTPP